MNKKIKILHLSQATGGVKTYVALVLKHLPANLFEFVVVAPENREFEFLCSQINVKYYRVNLNRGNNPFTNVKALSQIIGILKKETPDIIHAHSAKGGFLGRLASCFTKRQTIIYTPHAFSYLPFQGLKRLIFFSLEVLAKRWTTKLLAISHSEANRAIFELGFAEEDVQVILNSIPIEDISSRMNEASIIKIRMIGRLTQQKNPLLYLQVANILSKKYKNLSFSILGAGIHDELSDKIYSYLDDNHLRGKIEILKWGDEETSKVFLREADIYVMMSIFEGLPFSLLEAMSNGVPCVVSKVDGNTDVIQNFENGFSCLTVDEFCQKIELLIHDQGLRKRIGLSGAQYVRRYHDIDEMANKLSAYYKSTLHIGYKIEP